MQNASKFPGTSNAFESQPSTSSFLGHLVSARNSRLASTPCRLRSSTALIGVLASTPCSARGSTALAADLLFDAPFFFLAAPFLADFFFVAPLLMLLIVMTSLMLPPHNSL